MYKNVWMKKVDHGKGVGNVEAMPHTFYSGALNSRKTCYVLLPENYDTMPERHYPVVYLLHGYGGSETDWQVKGKADETVRSMQREGKLRDAIVVMPNDGGYDQGTFYMDWYDGSGNFEQYIVYDLIPEIDKQFRTIRSHAGRVVAGFSMGGYGAFMLSLKNPGLFGAAASISGAFTKIEEYKQSDAARLVGPLQGPYAEAYDLRALFRKSAEHSFRPEIYFNCGSEDFLIEPNRSLHSFLEELPYRHYYEEMPGEHQWSFAAEHLRSVMEFFEAFFHAHLSNGSDHRSENS